MKVVHNEPAGKYKYHCSVCCKGFNWDENSSYYGKMEYKTVTEKQELEKYFCSNKCWLKFK